MLKLLPLMIILLLLSGCITQQVHLIEKRSYNRDDVLREITFFPEKLANPISISYTLTLPNGARGSTYQTSFPPGTIECHVSAKNTVLYYPGLWTVEYTIMDGDSLYKEGKHYFWVQDNITSLARLDLESYENNQLSILNAGKEPGYVHIVVYGDRTYFDTRIYLKPGHRTVHTVFTGPEQLYLILNEKEIRI